MGGVNAVRVASACGKLLLFGEHAVVHGVPAIAVGLSDGVEVVRVDGPPGWHVPAWGVDTATGAPESMVHAHRALCEAAGTGPVRLAVTSRIPAGCGLGSSAALAVASARALIEDDEAAVAVAAAASESVFHGNASGLDQAAATRGGVIRFVRGAPPEVRDLAVGGRVALVVASVGAGASTAEMVAGVQRRISRFPRVGGGMLEAVSALVGCAERALAAGDVDELGELMDINHGLLCAFGVSTGALDRACYTARDAGAAGAKLTGGGGGGCIVAVSAEEHAVAVAAALRSDHEIVRSYLLTPDGVTA